MRQVRSMADTLNKATKDFEKSGATAEQITAKWQETFGKTRRVMELYAVCECRVRMQRRWRGRADRKVGVDLVEVMQRYLAFDLGENQKVRASGKELLTKALRDANLGKGDRCRAGVQRSGAAGIAVRVSSVPQSDGIRYHRVCESGYIG